MKISTKGRYALRFLIDLAQHQEENFVSVKDISERQKISRKYLEQILPLLTGAGMLKATRGANGGYKLTRETTEYTVSEILKVTEKNIIPVTCLEAENNECELRDICRTLPMWIGLSNVIDKYLSSITLQDLLDGNIDTDPKVLTGGNKN